jgi:site-specific DNA-methyltransferase (adenine-specific)
MKKDWKVLVGNNIDLLKSYEDNTFDSIVTDPPYGIEFLGKDWDKDTGAMETWEECLRVLKPGGYILAFSAARTYHNLATNIESAGFEIRDQIMWLYGSGFPKAQDMGKTIDKRAGKKDPNYGSNKHSGMVTEGQGRKDYRCLVCNKTLGSWIKDCKEEDCGQRYNYQTEEAQQWAGWKTALKPAHEPIVMARKPFKGSCIDNVLKHGVGALNIDGSRVEYDEDGAYWSNWKKNSLQTGGPRFEGNKEEIEYNKSETETYSHNNEGRYPSNVIGEVTDYQKYFYCPKIGRAERHVGFDNNHPTVKPVELMKYLVKLVTPEGGIVLDPFNGSGSTGMACVELGYEYVGCELDPNYVEIATNRIAAWEAKFNDDHFDSLFDK